MKCVVIGGGAAGMFCSGLLAQNGHEVILIEKNEKLGRKLYITGKGRCNITNNSDIQSFLQNIATNPKFAISSIYKFTPQDTMDFFESNGVPLKTERGNRVFPESDKSSDIIKCLTKFIETNGVEVRLKSRVVEIVKEDNCINSVKLADGSQIDCNIVVVATGGMSYALTGSSGDGYKFAKSMDIAVVEPKPALSALITNSTEDLAGLSLKNVEASIYSNDKKLFSEFGEMLFTHTGVSGPIILSLSSKINKYYVNKKFNRQIALFIDLKPALTSDQLDLRLVRELSSNPNMEIKNVMSNLLPKSLISYVLTQAHVSFITKANSITREERLSIAKVLKGLKFKVLDIEKLDLAIITSGGIDVSEINPKDMQSKKVSGLYFIGEVIDVDALTGGFNLQIALSTAYAMANSL